MAKKSKYAGIASFVIFTLLPLLSSSYLTFLLFKHQDALGTWGTAEWIVASLILVFLCALAIVPPTFLALVMGYFMGYWAFPYLVAINMLAIILIFGLSRVINFQFVREWLEKNPKAHEIMEKIRADEIKVIFFTKLSPLFPFAVTNLIFAASGASFRNIVVGGFLGMIPRTALAVYVGTQGKELQALINDPNGGAGGTWTVVSLVIISVVGLYLTFKKK